MKGLRRARTTTAQRGLHCPNRAAGASTSNRQSTFCRGGAPQGWQARERRGGRRRRKTERLKEGGETPPFESPLWGYHRATANQRLQEDAVRGRQRRGRVAAGARRPGARQFWILGAPKGTISRSFVVPPSASRATGGMGIITDLNFNRIRTHQSAQKISGERPDANRVPGMWGGRNNADVDAFASTCVGKSL